MFLQEGSSCVWNRPGPSLPSRPCRRGRGWQARGGQHLCSRSLLSVSLSFLTTDPSLITRLYLLALQTLLPTSLSCLIMASPPHGAGGEMAANSQLDTSFHHPVVSSVSFSCFFQSSPFLGMGARGWGWGGKVATVIGLEFVYLSAPHSPSLTSLPLAPPSRGGSLSHLESQLPLPYTGARAGQFEHHVGGRTSLEHGQLDFESSSSVTNEKHK